ncbi:Phytochrome-like protein cph2 [Pseudidiomarina piscicola]|uniref:Phytochrome-like protein cph2 n=1 Tax=Pseudidiomarina piscicola TaxID=2614830 RepID=A0A6S6WQZ1_9GAMM|nr:bifunctional diguanylate cyclase/phosphodiesterase [Pseudidiomarina piscicola]CAB0150287.1 Phytochrome-like protein cph2 [Pseudidiomarina piscicola]VZT39715.1 Phytochrome-like protein cph2 [Pseudomonas aeruginosa]
MSPRRAAAFIAILYVVAGVVWIRFSDQFLLSVIPDPNLLTEYQSFKGWAYVFTTGVVLYLLAKMALDRERRLSQRDGLTKLLNRHMFGQELASELEFCAESQQPMIVVVLNIDGFKQLNRNAGSEAGDSYLQNIAALLREHFQQRIILGRFGGDEFAIAIPASSWPGQVLAQLQHLQQRIQTQTISELPDTSLTACFGIACYPTDAPNTELLVKAALTALDEAKSMGTNRLRVYKSEYGEHASRRTKLLFDLKAAIANRRLSVAYQPQFKLDESGISGVEVLARWDHPEEGVIAPDVFIPLAEQHGLICDITDFIMQTAIQELTNADLLYRQVPRLSFNVSAADFNNSHGTERFLHNLAELTGDWSVIELELTETSALLNLAGVKGVLNVLRERGVQVSLDDFGTGYSSLSTLRLLPIQEVKIDQSFVRDLATNANDARLVKTIIAMANALNLRVIAEGVESQQQAHYLKQAGCDEVQGYLYAKPMNLKALQSFIKNLSS